ncbi:hypothetical protein D3C77_427550 [compost metagenome]
MAGSREVQLRSALTALIAAAGSHGLDMDLLTKSAIARLFSADGGGKSDGKRTSAAVEELEIALGRAKKL